MIAVPPIDCTAVGVLVSTNSVDWLAYNAANTYAAYVEATGYTTSTACSYAGRNWTSLQAANTAHTPGAAGSELWWSDAGPINSLAMFDTSVQTATSRTGGLEWTLKTGRVTCVGLMGLVGASVTITVRDGLAGAVIYTDTQTLQTGDGTYYAFCFEDLIQRSDVSWTGLLGSIDGHITISIASTGAAACGLCVAGKQVYLGQATYGFSMPLESRGRQYLDSLNNPVSIDRGYVRNCSGTLMSDADQFNRLLAFYSTNITEPFFWLAAPGLADLVSASGFGKISRVVPAITEGMHTTSIDIAGYR